MQLLYAAAHALPTLDIIARGGGGGSSSGDGGGGGIFAVGFFPPYLAGDWCTRRFNRLTGAIVGGIVALVVIVFFSIIALVIAPFEVFLIIISAIIGAVMGTFNLIGRAKEAAKKVKKKVVAAASTDAAWQEEKLQARVAQTFTDYQNDWSNFNLEHIKTYTTERYFNHISLMLAALKVMGRQNVVSNAQILEKYIAEISDSADNSKDNFVVIMRARADDTLWDVTAREQLYTDNNPFVEAWRFVRSGDTWLLDSIDQETADISQKHDPLKKFAEENGMFYSLDWGWLLLPKRGRLFKLSNFKRSDINNHVIGTWNGIIVQMYTYRPSRDQYENYQIAQITLPKSYGGIIIKRKKFLNITPSGYMRLSYEWPDFNNRYAVFATDIDKVTSFELLNPKFMADLYDKNLKVEIEVVDNVVYLYSKVGVGETQYPEMLEILRQAFHELKM